MANPGMNSLIKVINKLQDHVSTAGMPPMAFNLPQIVVVGSQSAGKSSVLENFVGREFLPRGADIVTRRPLVLQMVYDAKHQHGEFSHDKSKPPRQYKDFADIRKEIEAETERMAPGKFVSAVPINLRIYSPNVLDLTLVDLPGLTLVATADQPADIEHQIREIVMQYAKESNALILAVSPANVDLANSAALKLAKEVDPHGERTISVITKVDLMAIDSDARPILSNRLLKLKLGHWGVINTSRKKESEFFDNNAAYSEPDIAKQCGTPKLQAALVEQLSIHIRDCLPGLREGLRRQLTKMAPEIAEHRKYEAANTGDALLSKYKELNGIMGHLASAFERCIEAISGVPAATGAAILTSSLDGGARISNVFHVSFHKKLMLICDDEERSAGIDEKIANAIHNSHGIRSVVFPHQKAFEAIVSDAIELMHEPCVNCVDDVVQELQKTFSQLIKASPGCNINRYPALRNEIERRFEFYLAQRQTVVKDFIEQFVHCQRMYFNTNHTDFVNVDEIVEEDSDAEDEGEENSDKNMVSGPSSATYYLSSVKTVAISSHASDKTGSETSKKNAAKTKKQKAKDAERKQAERENNDPPRMHHHINKVYVMMKSYMEIMQWNLYDNVPKFIVSMLIYDVIKYLREGLPSELHVAVLEEHEYKKTTSGGKSASVGGNDDRGRRHLAFDGRDA